MNENFKVSKKCNIYAVVKDDKGKLHICCGGFAATSKTFDTYEQAEKYIGTKPYELIYNTMFIMLKKQNENENTKETKEPAKKSKKDA